MDVQVISSGFGKLSLNGENTSICPVRLQSLENTILNLYKGQHITEKTFQKIKERKKELQEILFKYFPERPTLTVYGSIVNGFGNSDSDVDLSLKINLKNVKEKDGNEVLKKVCELIIKSDGKCGAEFIATAKIPIVTIPNWRGLEIDISYDNWTAIENTHLLAAYCDWAPEILPQLGFLVKKWAKGNRICGVEDYFTSFHWILLVIYYLQRVEWNGKLKKYKKNKNRCLPFIQYEFWEGAYSKKPWKYFKAEPIPNWSNNRDGIVYHFYEFLKFYLKFPFQSKVIQIINPLSTYQRRRTEYKDPVVLRAPFFMGHNNFRNRLNYQQQMLYLRLYSRPNITGMITQKKLDEMLKAMDTAVADIERYIREGTMVDPVMKRIFNV